MWSKTRLQLDLEDYNNYMKGIQNTTFKLLMCFPWRPRRPSGFPTALYWRVQAQWSGDMLNIYTELQLTGKQMETIDVVQQFFFLKNPL